eukprot:scaffold7377_cov389-Prasinococcus_capsulatus_cf.AAC.34
MQCRSWTRSRCSPIRGRRCGFPWAVIDYKSHQVPYNSKRQRSCLSQGRPTQLSIVYTWYKFAQAHHYMAWLHRGHDTGLE